MKRILFLFANTAFLFCLVNCNNTKELTTQSEVLFRNKWKLAEVQGQRVSDTLNTSFEFTPGKISGSTGCNRLSAGFVAGRHQTITFTPGASTKMACMNEAGTLETKFLDALSKSTKWKMNEGELWLTGEGGTLVKMKSL